MAHTCMTLCLSSLIMYDAVSVAILAQMPNSRKGTHCRQSKLLDHFSVSQPMNPFFGMNAWATPGMQGMMGQGTGMV